MKKKEGTEQGGGKKDKFLMQSRTEIGKSVGNVGVGKKMTRVKRVWSRCLNQTMGEWGEERGERG